MRPVVYKDRFGDLAGLDFTIRKRRNGDTKSWRGRPEVSKYMAEVTIERDLACLTDKSTTAQIVGLKSSMEKGETDRYYSLQFIYQAFDSKACNCLEKEPEPNPKIPDWLVNLILFSVILLFVAVCSSAGYKIDYDYRKS